MKNSTCIFQFFVRYSYFLSPMFSGLSLSGSKGCCSSGPESTLSYRYRSNKPSCGKNDRSSTNETKPPSCFRFVGNHMENHPY